MNQLLYLKSRSMRILGRDFERISRVIFERQRLMRDTRAKYIKFMELVHTPQSLPPEDGVRCLDVAPMRVS